jgi:hypothetical protein
MTRLTHHIERQVEDTEALGSCATQEEGTGIPVTREEKLFNQEESHGEMKVMFSVWAFGVEIVYALVERFQKLFKAVLGVLILIDGLKAKLTLCFHGGIERREEGAWQIGVPLHEEGENAALMGEGGMKQPEAFLGAWRRWPTSSMVFQGEALMHRLASYEHG